MRSLRHPSVLALALMAACSGIPGDGLAQVAPIQVPAAEMSDFSVLDGIFAQRDADQRRPKRGDARPGRGDERPGRGDERPGRADDRPGRGDERRGRVDDRLGRGDERRGRVDERRGDERRGRVDERRGRFARPVVVIRPVRPWVRRAHYGRVIGGIALGTIIVVGAGAVPVTPGPDTCWYWVDPSQTRGYWDYCE